MNLLLQLSASTRRTPAYSSSIPTTERAGGHMSSAAASSSFRWSARAIAKAIPHQLPSRLTTPFHQICTVANYEYLVSDLLVLQGSNEALLISLSVVDSSPGRFIRSVSRANGFHPCIRSLNIDSQNSRMATSSWRPAYPACSTFTSSPRGRIQLLTARRSPRR